MKKPAKGAIGGLQGEKRNRKQSPCLSHFEPSSTNKRDAVPLWAATKCRMTRVIFAKLKGDHGVVVKAMLDCLHYCDTGICEASYNEIAEAASAARSTVALAIRAARKAGLIRVIGTHFGGRNKRNRYVFTYNGADVTNQTVFNGERNSPNGGLFKERNSPNDDSKQSEIASQTVRGSDDSSLNPYDSLKGKKGEGSPLPREGAASPSPPKKRNGLQSETDEKREREANAAKLDEAAASLKAMGVKANPKPPPRMNGPTRYKSTEADLRLYELQALGVDVDDPTANTPKSKPAPQTLEPALVESQSIFMSVTGKVEPPGFPELPDFLRRTPEPEATR